MERHLETHIIVWEGIEIEIVHTPSYFAGQDHIEVRSLRPEKAKLPITETGYRSHFCAPIYIENAGGAVGFVRSWLEGEARTKTWQERDAKDRQLSLF